MACPGYGQWPQSGHLGLSDLRSKLHKMCLNILIMLLYACIFMYVKGLVWQCENAINIRCCLMAWDFALLTIGLPRRYQSRFQNKFRSDPFPPPRNIDILQMYKTYWKLHKTCFCPNCIWHLLHVPCRLQNAKVLFNIASFYIFCIFCIKICSVPSLPFSAIRNEHLESLQSLTAIFWLHQHCLTAEPVNGIACSNYVVDIVMVRSISAYHVRFWP